MESGAEALTTEFVFKKPERQVRGGRFRIFRKPEAVARIPLADGETRKTMAAFTTSSAVEPREMVRLAATDLPEDYWDHDEGGPVFAKEFKKKHGLRWLGNAGVNALAAVGDVFQNTFLAAYSVGREAMMATYGSLRRAHAPKIVAVPLAGASALIGAAFGVAYGFVTGALINAPYRIVTGKRTQLVQDVVNLATHSNTRLFQPLGG